MIIKTRYIVQHQAGHYINLRYEPVKEIDKAAWFHTPEEAEQFYRFSHFKSDKPDEYKPVAIKITYELEVEANEREHEYLREGSECS